MHYGPINVLQEVEENFPADKVPNFPTDNLVKIERVEKLLKTNYKFVYYHYHYGTK